MANQRLSKEIRPIHHEVNGAYGQSRIKTELTAMGHAYGRYRVALLMRGQPVCPFTQASSNRHDLPIAQNHPDRQFASELTGIGSRT